MVTLVGSEHKQYLDGAINAPEEPGNGVQPPNEQCMLRIDTAVQLTVHCYYRVLGYKSEGGTGDTQIKMMTQDGEENLQQVGLEPTEKINAPCTNL